MSYIKKYWKTGICALAMILVLAGAIGMLSYRTTQHHDFEQRLHIARHLASRPDTAKPARRNR